MPVRGVEVYMLEVQENAMWCENNGCISHTQGVTNELRRTSNPTQGLLAWAEYHAYAAVLPVALGLAWLS